MSRAPMLIAMVGVLMLTTIELGLSALLLTLVVQRWFFDSGPAEHRDTQPAY